MNDYFLHEWEKFYTTSDQSKKTLDQSKQIHFSNQNFSILTYFESAVNPFSPVSESLATACLNLWNSSTSLEASMGSSEDPNVEDIQFDNGLAMSTSDVFFGCTVSSSVILKWEKSTELLGFKKYNF